MDRIPRRALPHAGAWDRRRRLWAEAEEEAEEGQQTEEAECRHAEEAECRHSEEAECRHSEDSEWNWRHRWNYRRRLRRRRKSASPPATKHRHASCSASWIVRSL